jgi:hypothetical protein
MFNIVRIVVLIGAVAIVPLGLRLAGGEVLRRAAVWWPAPALLGALSLWLPRGPVAYTLAGCYAAAAVALAVVAPVRLARRRDISPPELAFLTALICPAIAAAALVAERAGYRLFGFDLEILALTVPHFHFAGFAAALIAGLAAHGAPRSRLASAGALCVPAGTALVFAGYFLSDIYELAGAVVLTAGMWAVALVMWRHIRPGTKSPLTRGLLGVSAATLAATMVLAVSYAVGEAFDVPHLSLTWMAATHGIANAAGFAVCGLLAWRRIQEETL